MICARFVGAFWALGTFRIDLHRRSRRWTGHGLWLPPVRTPSHVEGFCRAFSIDAAHSYATADGSGDAAYDALIADPDVDAIYFGSSAWHAYALGLSRAARRKGRAVRKAGRFE